MLQNAHRRVVDLVAANPGPAYAVAIGSLTVGIGTLRTAWRRHENAGREVERALREHQEAEAAPRFGHGAFLDGLAAVPPTLDASACESLGTYVGFAAPAQTEADGNFAALMLICRKLPATVDDAPRLQSQIDSLRKRVDLLSHSHYRVAERDEGLAAIDSLWREAVQLRKRLEQQAPQPEHLPLMANGSRAGAGPTRGGVPQEDDPSTGASGMQTVKRRHRTVAHVEAPAMPQPSKAAAFVLTRTQCRDIRAAIAQAWADRDGVGRITDNENRRLGVAIAGVTRGTYPTHLAHGGPQERRFTIDHVLARATQYMTAWHRDAVRSVAEAYLQKLALSEKP